MHGTEIVSYPEVKGCYSNGSIPKSTNPISKEMGLSLI